MFVSNPDLWPHLPLRERFAQWDEWELAVGFYAI